MGLQILGTDDRLLSLTLSSERFPPPRTSSSTEYLWLAFTMHADGTVVRLMTPTGIPDHVSFMDMIHLMRQPGTSYEWL